MITSFIKFISALLFSCLIWWLAGSLVAWSFNPAEWWGIGRFIIVLMIIFSTDAILND